ncbi:MAG: hypothetical protein QOD06_3504, partial [Candidatus Binatota bacterium]|nr:hypothetical protein [Candidatus Binatota bacterium]
MGVGSAGVGVGRSDGQAFTDFRDS